MIARRMQSEIKCDQEEERERERENMHACVSERASENERNYGLRIVRAVVRRRN